MGDETTVLLETARSLVPLCACCGHWGTHVKDAPGGSAVMQRVCLVCGTTHYNACPSLWGGEPERPEPELS